MTTEAVAGGLVRPLLIFTGVLVAGQAVLYGIGQTFPDFDMPSSFGLIIAMVAAMTGGQSFAKATGRAFAGGEQLRFSLTGVAISIALSLATIAAMFAWYGVPFSTDMLALVMTGDPTMAADIRPWLPVIFGIGLLIGWAVIHFGAGAGAKGMLKRMAKDAAKNS
ncbi:ABZJ_00895 family protein [Tabrizicola sp.]|jgi:F0F1-type ATP synthase assembly protein I|uniref:ABZJ_00895 family protein n=1 Tax=Tabrizicola sp. TaxID=2005166 RepID=UPI001A3EB037|nr:ABZJ_00895 family protein [Tabrizicola sp.]MBL9072074.1 ABZJ_00895 family protein [Tabrizicola sp.]